MSKSIDHSKVWKSKWSKQALLLQSDNKLTDVYLKAWGSDRHYYCHKIVLASASSYFKNLFESNEKNYTVGLENDKLDEKTLKDLIDYMYKAEIRIDLQNVIILHKFAERFSLLDLRDEALQFLKTNITIEMCLEYWRYSVKLQNENLINDCLTYIKNNCADFLDKSTINLTEVEMEVICKNLQGLRKDPIILKAIRTWILHDFGIRNFKLESLLKTIDIKELTRNDINELQENPQLKNNSDCTQFVLGFYKN